MVDHQDRLEKAEANVNKLSAAQSRLEAVVEGMATELRDLIGTVKQLAVQMQTVGRMDAKTIIGMVGTLLVAYWALTDRVVAPVKQAAESNVQAIAALVERDRTTTESIGTLTQQSAQNQASLQDVWGVLRSEDGIVQRLVRVEEQNKALRDYVDLQTRRLEDLTAVNTRAIHFMQTNRFTNEDGAAMLRYVEHLIKENPDAR